MAEMSGNRLDDKKSMRELLKIKYLHQTGLIVLVFVVIFSLAWFELIDKAVTGTLVGTAIGSVFKFTYRTNNSKKSKEEDQDND